MRPAGEVAHAGIDPAHRGLRQPFIPLQTLEEGARYGGVPITGVIMVKQIKVEGKEAGNVPALGLLRRIGLAGDLGGIVERGQGDEVFRPLLFERHNIMS